jgi:hypothetical protein
LKRKCIPGERHEDSREIEKEAAELSPGSPEVAPAERDRGNDGAIDAVEAALAKALTAASAAGRFDVVAQLARELEARRTARAGNVVAFDRAKRRGRP